MARTVMQPRAPYTCEGVVDKTLPASSPLSRTGARVNTEVKPDFDVANFEEKKWRTTIILHISIKISTVASIQNANKAIQTPTNDHYSKNSPP